MESKISLGDGRLRQFGSGRAFGGALFLPFLNRNEGNALNAVDTQFNTAVSIHEWPIEEYEYKGEISPLEFIRKPYSYIKLYWNCNIPITCLDEDGNEISAIPITKELVFGHNFNNGGQPIPKGVLPLSLKKITFGANFNRRTELSVFSNLTELTELDLGGYIGILTLGVLPVSLQKLTLSSFYNIPGPDGSPYQGLSYLKNLTELYFSGGFKLTPGIFPPSLKKLTFGGNRFCNSIFDPRIDDDRYPDPVGTPIELGIFSNLMELEELALGGYHNILTPGMFPPSLKKLILYNTLLRDGVYWRSVKANKAPIQLGVFSNLIELTELYLGFYQHDLTPGMFPPSLKKLIFNDFRGPFKKGVLPDSLLELTVSRNFATMIPFKPTLPLTDEDIKHYAEYTINSSVIPDSLISIEPKHLSIFLEKCPNDGKCTNNDKFHWERFRHVLQKQPYDYYPDYDEDGSLGELFGYDKRHYADETEDGSWGGGLFGYGTRLKSKMRQSRKRQSRKRQSRKRQSRK